MICCNTAQSAKGETTSSNSRTMRVTRRRRRMRLKQTMTKKKKTIIMCGTALGLRVELIRAVNGTLRLRMNHKVKSLQRKS